VYIFITSFVEVCRSDKDLGMKIGLTLTKVAKPIGHLANNPPREDLVGNGGLMQDGKD
jgi:hypothetical protein